MCVHTARLYHITANLTQVPTLSECEKKLLAVHCPLHVPISFIAVEETSIQLDMLLYIS